MRLSYGGRLTASKMRLTGERRKQSTFEQRISELNEKLRNAENTVSTTSSQLVRESSSLDVLNKTKVDYSTSSLFIFENNLIIHFDMCF